MTKWPTNTEIVAAYYLSHGPEADHPAWKPFLLETFSHFLQLVAEGWTFDRGNFQPYSSTEEMTRLSLPSKTLFVSSQFQTFEEGHPLAAKAPNGWLWNEIFRATHDILGHLATQSPMDFAGELQAYENHSDHYSPKALPALAGETLGPLCVYMSRGAFQAIQRPVTLPHSTLNLLKGEL